MLSLNFVQETPQYPIPDLNVAHFQRGVDYTNWRSQGTNDWLLILTLDGCGHVASGDCDVRSCRGTVTLYQPRTPQHYYTDAGIGRWNFHWAHFHPLARWQPWLDWPEQTRGLRSLVLKDESLIRSIASAMSDAARYRFQNRSESVDLAYNALERAILWINSANLYHGLDERIRRAADLLAGKLDEPFSLGKLAHECSLSVSRLSHLFSEQMGTSPQQYHEKIRLQWAAELLRSSGLPVNEIAAEIGYVNAFYFSARFKNAYGKSPLSYRRGSHARKKSTRGRGGRMA